MPTGRAVTIAAVLASIALLPVIIILALGLYGSAVTGDFPLVDESGPVLRVEPESGPPGSELTIRGSRWEEGTLLRLEMVVQVARPEITFGGDVETVEQPLPGVYVGEVVISRAGTFSIETQLPTTVPLLPGTQIEFLGSAAYRGGEPAGDGRTTFLVEPAPGQLEVEVLADASGDPLPETLVEVRGRQGQLVAVGHTGTDGIARFEGLASDVAYHVTARAAGHETLRAPSIQAGVETPGEVTFVLPTAPQGSIFVGGVPGRGDAASPTLAVIDRPSLAPVRDAEIKAAGAAWALAADPIRGRLYVADELATEIRVFNVQTGRIAAPIPLAFSLRVEVRDEDDKPPPSAVVHLLWSVRGREVLVQGAGNRRVRRGGVRRPDRRQFVRGERDDGERRKPRSHGRGCRAHHGPSVPESRHDPAAPDGAGHRHPGLGLRADVLRRRAPDSWRATIGPRPPASWWRTWRSIRYRGCCM